MSGNGSPKKSVKGHYRKMKTKGGVVIRPVKGHRRKKT